MFLIALFARLFLFIILFMCALVAVLGLLLFFRLRLGMVNPFLRAEHHRKQPPGGTVIEGEYKVLDNGEKKE